MHKGLLQKWLHLAWSLPVSFAQKESKCFHTTTTLIAYAPIITVRPCMWRHLNRSSEVHQTLGVHPAVSHVGCIYSVGWLPHLGACPWFRGPFHFGLLCHAPACPLYRNGKRHRRWPAWLSEPDFSIKRSWDSLAMSQNANCCTKIKIESRSWQKWL